MTTTNTKRNGNAARLTAVRLSVPNRRIVPAVRVRSVRDGDKMDAFGYANLLRDSLYKVPKPEFRSAIFSDNNLSRLTDKVEVFINAPHRTILSISHVYENQVHGAVVYFSERE